MKSCRPRPCGASAAAKVRQRMTQAGCDFNFKRRRWDCPSCRARLVLQFQLLPDGSVRFDCERRCPLENLLGALDLTFWDVGPAMYRGAT